MKLSELLSVPYVLQIESIEKEDGNWICRAAFPELPECVVERNSPLTAIDELEDMRIQTIFKWIEDGKAVPALRPALNNGEFNLTMEPIANKCKRLGLVQWLDRLNEDVKVTTD